MDALYDDEEAPRVLCFGDSNTWGYEPVSGRRYAFAVRWPGVLAAELGRDWRIVEEGLSGRTTVFEDPLNAGRSGLSALPTLLLSHAPVSAVVIMLGSNDFMTRFAAPAGDIARGMGLLAEAVLVSGAGPGGDAPAVLLVAPPRLGEMSGYAETYEGGAAKSRLFASRLEEVSRLVGVDFLDGGLHAEPSARDGLHLEPEGHERLGKAIAAKLLAMFRT